ncbi:hypothetical protein KR222_000585 [Zaprionus bogoriensis]|nr:hypothetical protein KR222_000585 [Zaprionus bogoriensis]
MSQQIRVLQCLECNLYQVDIVKKSNKWECKVCRAKQVVQREFHRGTGAECRAKVQQLNLQHGERRQQQQEQQLQRQSAIEQQLPAAESCQRPSKWAAFVDEPNRDLTESKSVRRKPQQELNDETEDICIQGAAVKRKAPFEAVVMQHKPHSKWQKFL